MLFVITDDIYRLRSDKSATAAHRLLFIGDNLIMPFIADSHRMPSSVDYRHSINNGNIVSHAARRCSTDAVIVVIISSSSSSHCW